MIITTEWDEVIDMSDLLIKNECALKPPSTEIFKERYQKSFMKIIERWNDNGRTGGVLRKTDGYVKLFEYEKYLLRHKARQQSSRFVRNILKWKKTIKGYEHLKPDTDDSDQDERKIMDIHGVTRKHKSHMQNTCRAQESDDLIEEYEFDEFESVSQASSRTSS
jgi:hypothetical protein